MKNIKNFESWKNNIIDHTLFTSGKAKYDPKVIGGIIKYKTGNIEPYYHATIEKKGNKFICKIYKKDEDGNDVRLRNKIKKELKIAHNYVREFLNQKLKRDIEKEREKEKGVEKKDRIFRDKPEYDKEDVFEPPTPPITKHPQQPIYQESPIIKPRTKTIIRRF